MLKYLRTGPPAPRIEFAAAGLWIVAGLAAAIAVGIQWSVNPPAPLVTPDGVVHPNPPMIQPILTLMGIAVVGALPSLYLGAVLRPRTRSVLRTAAIAAIVLGLLYVGVVAWVAIRSLSWAASNPEASGGVDPEFLAIGILVVVTGLMHILSGVVALRGLGRGNRVSGPRLAGA